MNHQLCIATSSGLYVFERDGEAWHETAYGLANEHVTSVIAREGVILAGTERGIYRSDDLGQTWQEASAGLTLPHVRWLAFHPDISDREFAGTEPAGIFVSHDGGGSWRECPEVAALRDRHEWMLPYSPEAGCVRGFAFHGSRAYAAVEVGGVLRSDDGGETWRLADGSDGNPDLEGPPAPMVYPDVHSIVVPGAPSSPDTVFAPTGGGFYRSGDGGRTWDYLYECYCRAMWIDPNDADHLVLGPADDVDANGRIESSRDGGETWSPASKNLNAPWRRGMVERFTQVGDELIAMLSNGHLHIARLDDLEWRQFLPELKRVNCVAVMQGGAE
jgi:photosystem II stability/assembly factor-like uncharacterized protein